MEIWFRGTSGRGCRERSRGQLVCEQESAKGLWPLPEHGLLLADLCKVFRTILVGAAFSVYPLGGSGNRIFIGG